jgi:hypothetical protein
MRTSKTTKAVQPMGIEQTVRTSNAVQLSLLTSSKNKFLPAGMSIEGILQAELDARNHVMKAGEATNLKAQRDAIQLHEFGRIKQRAARPDEGSEIEAGSRCPTNVGSNEKIPSGRTSAEDYGCDEPAEWLDNKGRMHIHNILNSNTYIIITYLACFGGLLHVVLLRIAPCCFQ